MRIGRRPHIHANFLQGLPIAILSIFNGLEQEVKRYVIFPSPARTLCPGALRSRRLRVRSVDAAIDRLRRAAARPPALLPRRQLAEQRRLVEGAWIAIAVASRSTSLMSRGMAFTSPSATPRAARRNAGSSRANCIVL